MSEDKKHWFSIVFVEIFKIFIFRVNFLLFY